MKPDDQAACFRKAMGLLSTKTPIMCLGVSLWSDELLPANLPRPRSYLKAMEGH